MDSRGLSTFPQIARRALLLVPCLLLMLSTSALANLGETHPVLIMTGVDQAHLELAGWLTSETADVTVVEAPRFGIWQNERYIPDDGFWRLGGDRVILSITEGETVGVHTIVLIAAAPERGLFGTEDFESSGGLIAATPWQEDDLVNAVDVTDGDAVEGSWSLQVERAEGGGSVRQRLIGPPGKGINGVDQLGGKGAVNPDLPGGGGGGGGSGPIQNLPSGEPFTLLDLNSLARVEMRFSPSGELAQVRAVASSILGCSVCETDWRNVPLRADTAVGLWLGRDHLEHPDSTYATLHFAVHPPGGALQRDRLTGLVSPAAGDFQLEVGAHGAPDLGSVKLDLLEWWWDQVGRAIPLQVTAEDFGGGAWGDDWHVVGPVKVTDSRNRYDWVGAVDLLDVIRRRDQRAAWIDTLADSTPRLRVEFDVELEGNALASGTEFAIWGTSDNVGGATQKDAFQPVDIEMRQVDSGPEIRARIRDNHGRTHASPWLAVPTGGKLLSDGVPVVLHWWAEQDEEALGGLQLRVGDIEATVEGVRNAGQTVVEQAVGMWGVRLPTNGLSLGQRSASATLLIDDVILSY